VNHSFVFTTASSHAWDQAASFGGTPSPSRPKACVQPAIVGCLAMNKLKTSADEYPWTSLGTNSSSDARPILHHSSHFGDCSELSAAADAVLRLLIVAFQCRRAASWLLRIAAK
jgi:hypothetical protein